MRTGIECADRYPEVRCGQVSHCHTRIRDRVVVVGNDPRSDVTGRVFPDTYPTHLVPFDAERKRGATVHQTNGGFLACVKGAPFNLFPLCTHVLEADGPIETFTPSYLAYIESVYKLLARDGLRIIACAYRDLEQDYTSEQEVEHDLIFAGLIAMYDPPRVEVKNAVRIAKQAGIA